MKILRVPSNSARRDDLWQWVEALQDQFSRAPDDNGPALAGALAALQTWRGTFRGHLCELAYVAIAVVVSVASALVPWVSRTTVYCWYCDKPLPHRTYVVRWWRWAALVNPPPTDRDLVCPAGHVLVPAPREAA